MECEDIKKIIPKYFQHTANEEEIQSVEEHLCVCHDCRTILGELMDKAAEASELAAVPSQDQPESSSEDKIQEKITEKKEDMEYFPGEDVEAVLGKGDDVLEKPEPAKGDSGDAVEEIEPIVEEKAEPKKDEDDSFEIVDESSEVLRQELPTESDIEALGMKDFKPIKEEPKELEENVELPKEEEKAEPKKDEDDSFEIIDDPSEVSRQELPTESDIEALGMKDFEPIEEEPKELEENVELPKEEEKVEEKTELPLEEEKAEEKKKEDYSFEVIGDSLATPGQDSTVEEDQDALDTKSFDSAVEQPIELKENIELPKEEEKVEEKVEFSFEEEKIEKINNSDSIERVAVSKEDEESQESSEEPSYSLDQAPLNKDKENVGLFEYLCLVAGLGVLGFLAYLLLKG